MTFFYKGVQKSYLEGEAYSALYKSGFAREHGSKAICLGTLDNAALPIGTEIKIEKIYRMKRGYEPNAPFRSGEVAEYWEFQLKELSTWHDPKTGKSRPNKWAVTGHGVRKNSSSPFDEKRNVKEEVQMARKTSRRGAPDAEAAGEQYATDQIASEYFADWVREQLLEASKLPASDVLPLEDKHDAGIIAKNMLWQLQVDTKRELKDREMKDIIGADVTPSSHEAFYDGFRKACDGSRDWLADELLRIKGEMGVHETRTVNAKSDRYSLRQSPENALIYNAFYGTTHIGHVAGPYREGSSDYYQWKMNALAPSSEHQFGRRSLSGRGRTQTAAFNQLIQAHKSYGGVGEPHRPKARGSARRRA